MFIMKCDRCLAEIDYDENQVYHATGRINGVLNRHLHFCEKCYKEVFKCFLNIEIVVEKDKKEDE